MAKTSKVPSTKAQLVAAKGENKELRRLLRTMLPSGDRNSPDAFVTLIRQLSEHVIWLQSMETPLRSKSVLFVDEQRSAAESQVIPGTGLGDRPGDRNVYHGGRRFEREIYRLFRQLRNLLDQSAAWTRGIDLIEDPVGSGRRERCPCGELLAIAWKHCPACGVEVVTDRGVS